MTCSLYIVISKRCKVSVSSWAALTSTPRSRECNKHVLLTTDFCLECRVRQHLHMAGRLLGTFCFCTRLFRHKGCQAFQIPSTTVIDRLGPRCAVEPFQRRKSLNTESLAQVFVFVCIDVCDGDFVSRGRESGGKFFVDGG